MSDTRPATSTSTSSMNESDPCGIRTWQQDDERWKADVLQMISEHYDIGPRTTPTAKQIQLFFEGNGYAGILLSAVFDVFKINKSSRKRRPTMKMRVAFGELKKRQPQFCTIRHLPLRDQAEEPLFSDEVLTAYHIWSLARQQPVDYRNSGLIGITRESGLMTYDRHRVREFLEFCRGRYDIDERLFSIRNLFIFKEHYLDFVSRKRTVRVREENVHENDAT